MDAPTLDDFRDQFPEISTDDASDTKVRTGLRTAALFVDPDIWGALYPMAYLYYAAHMVSLTQQLELAAAVGNSGMTDTFVTDVTFENRKVSFGQRAGQAKVEGDANSGESLLGQTTYGQIYLQLRTRVVIPIVVI